MVCILPSERCILMSLGEGRGTPCLCSVRIDIIIFFLPCYQTEYKELEERYKPKDQWLSLKESSTLSTIVTKTHKVCSVYM